jgi:hypothetical protein
MLQLKLVTRDLCLGSLLLRLAIFLLVVKENNMPILWELTALIKTNHG